jgi:hypothetical protein
MKSLAELERVFAAVKLKRLQEKRALMLEIEALSEDEDHVLHNSAGRAAAALEREILGEMIYSKNLVKA